MKYKRIVPVLICFFMLVSAVSCRTAPPEAEEEELPAVQEPIEILPQYAVPGQADLSALEAAAARAAAARDLAILLDSPVFFPSEWDDAEALFEQARQQRDASNLEAARQSILRYERAADAFDALTGKTAARAFELALENLQAARDAAIAAGAKVYTPVFFLHADNTAERGMQEYEAGNFSAAKNSLLDAYTMYNTLAAGLNAYRLREEITARGFQFYDPQNVNLAEEALEAAFTNYDEGDYQAALQNAETALALFTQALNTAWTTITTRAATAAAEQRQRALDYRANIAVRPEFDLAETVYNRANTALRGQNFEYAVQLFVECTDMFMAAAQTALERRLAAEEALRRADERVAASEEIAIYADEILEGYIGGVE